MYKNELFKYLEPEQTTEEPGEKTNVRIRGSWIIGKKGRVRKSKRTRIRGGQKKIGRGKKKINKKDGQ